MDGGHHRHDLDARRALALVLVLVLGFAGVEALIGVAAGSLALLADAAHMLSDALALGLALFAAWLAHRPATPQRSFGWRRAEVLAALVNALVLVAIGVGIVWDYIALPIRDELAGVAPIEVVIPSDGTTSAPYVALLNTYDVHPNAAKLLLEYVLSDEGQIIQAKKYARPIRDDVVLPPDIAAAFPPAEAYAAVKPVTDWVQAATIGPSLAESWTIPVGQDS